MSQSEPSSSSSSSTVNQVVEEFPAPPAYYKNRALIASLSPPAVPVCDPYSKAYSGIFANVPKSGLNYDQNKEYGSLLKEQLKSVMKLAVGLISSASLDENKTRFEAVELRAALAKFHDLLNEYRVHEAREIYIRDLKDQLSQMTELEERLRRLAVMSCSLFLLPFEIFKSRSEVALMELLTRPAVGFDRPEGLETFDQVPAKRRRIVPEVDNELCEESNSNSVDKSQLTRDKQWENMYECLLEFEKQNGHCRFPLSLKVKDKYGKEVNLGKWIGTQRANHRKNTLSGKKLERLQALVDCGKLDWGSPKLDYDDERWEQHYQLLLDFRKTHGHCNVPERYSVLVNGDKSTERVCLGKWLERQRVKLKSSAMRADRLSRITPLINDGVLSSGSTKEDDVRWNQCYRALVAYASVYRHCNVPYKCEVEVEWEDGSRSSQVKSIRIIANSAQCTDYDSKANDNAGGGRSSTGKGVPNVVTQEEGDRNQTNMAVHNSNIHTDARMNNNTVGRSSSSSSSGSGGSHHTDGPNYGIDDPIDAGASVAGAGYGVDSRAPVAVTTDEDSNDEDDENYHEDDDNAPSDSERDDPSQDIITVSNVVTSDSNINNDNNNDSSFQIDGIEKTLTNSDTNTSRIDNDGGASEATSGRTSFRSVVKLGKWLASQRHLCQKKKQTSLRRERREQLQSLVDQGLLRWGEVHLDKQVKWDASLEALLRYDLEPGQLYNHVPWSWVLPLSVDLYGPQVRPGEWLAKQLRLKAEGRLSRDKEKRLQELVDQGTMMWETPSPQVQSTAAVVVGSGGVRHGSHMQVMARHILPLQDPSGSFDPLSFGYYSAEMPPSHYSNQQQQQQHTQQHHLYYHQQQQHLQYANNNNSSSGASGGGVVKSVSFAPSLISQEQGGTPPGYYHPTHQQLFYQSIMQQQQQLVQHLPYSDAAHGSADGIDNNSSGTQQYLRDALESMRGGGRGRDEGGAETGGGEGGVVSSRLGGGGEEEEEVGNEVDDDLLLLQEEHLNVLDELYLIGDDDEDDVVIVEEEEEEVEKVQRRTG